MTLMKLSGLLVIAGSTLAAPAVLAQGTGCEDLARTLATDATEWRAAITARPDADSVDGEEIPADMPEFCRVSGTTSPVAGSEIGFEIWLPAEGWNGRLRVFGNGGYSSDLPYGQMAGAAADGYAVAGTDTGHQGNDPDFARDNREAIADWGHRAVHETTLRAKEAVAAFYGRPQDYAYFTGCSTGGHQAFSEAQRYPDDFDGIVAGAPGHNRTHLNAGFLWLYLANHESGVDDRQIVPNRKLPMVAEAVFRQCKAQRPDDAGGLAADPFLNAPIDCEPDLSELSCGAVDGETCLTEPEINALQAMYDGARDPETGERIYFGWPVGSENAGTNAEKPGWSLYWSDFGSDERPARVSFWQIWAFDDPDWSWWDVDLSRDMTEADDRIARTVNAMDADLTEFEASGGKMIHYHGLEDPVVPALDSISYYRRVQQSSDDSTDFYRMFLAPGMQHCGGGPGPNSFDLQPLIEDWVERGTAPDRIVAAHHAGNDPEAGVAFTRPLCAYPSRAVYDGRGAANDAESYRCEAADEVQFEDIGPSYRR